MSSTINASTASGGGVITSADASGILQLQTGGVTGITIDASQNVTFAKSILTSATAQASTSGTSIDFTGIPSWAKRVTVMLNGVAISASGILIQIGSGSVTTSGYASSCVFANTGTTANTSSTAGFVSYAYTTTAASALYQLALVSANSWVCNGALSIGLGSVISTVGNSPALSGALDRVRITTISGAATFTAGSINIMYE